MERDEKGRGRIGKKKKDEFTGIKLKGGVLIGKIGGNSTPITTWRIGYAQSDGSLVKDPNCHIFTDLSARKLGANLMAVQTHLKVAVNMSNYGGSRRRHHHIHHHDDEEIVEVHTHLDEQSDSPIYQPASDSSLRRHIATSLTRHHQPVGKKGHALQLVSPASCSRSLEVAPYYPITPASPLNFKHKGETNMKTSAELLKVLNRIWILEEQHAANYFMVKTLKKELDYSREKIKELVQQRKKEGQEMDALMEQTAGNGNEVTRKSKERDRMKDAIQSLKDELESERKLRKHSESLHRKLAHEIFEVKSAFTNHLKEFERERKARILLENLCDEFAKGIRDHEKELWSLKHKPDKELITRESPERLILHISEVWLDERMQMKAAEARCDYAERNTIVEKLNFEIEAFLQAKQPAHMRNNNKLASQVPKENSIRRHSLESFHLNDAASAPRNGDQEEDSTGSGFGSFELKRNLRRKLREKGQTGFQEFNSCQLLHSLNRNHLLSRRGGKLYHDHHYREDDLDDQLAIVSDPNNKQQRMPRSSAPKPEISESYRTTVPRGIKENSLKARLLEAKLESQQSRVKSSNK